MIYHIIIIIIAGRNIDLRTIYGQYAINAYNDYNMIITTIFDYRPYIHIITINIISYAKSGDVLFASKMAKENIETVLCTIAACIL